MMRLWGKSAQAMARSYALDCWKKGDAQAYLRWHTVEWRIEQARAAPDYEGTVGGAERTVPRRRWYERPLAAIQQLGSSAMRGTGL